MPNFNITGFLDVCCPEARELRAKIDAAAATTKIGGKCSTTLIASENKKCLESEPYGPRVEIRALDMKDSDILVDALKKANIGVPVTVSASLEYYHAEYMVPDDGTE